MTYEQENAYLASLQDYLFRKGYSTPFLYFEHSPIEQGLIIKAEINWGDWKHDHLYYSHLVEEWAKENGFLILSPDGVEKVTEEDGSDCYSGIHHIGLYKA